MIEDGYSDLPPELRSLPAEISAAHRERRERSASRDDLGWRFLYSPRRVLAGAEIAFIGLNPGGRTKVKGHAEFSSESGSAYRQSVEDWGRSRPLQNQVIALFHRLGVKPEDVLAGNLFPFRSASERDLAERKQAVIYGCSIWRRVLEIAQPRLVLSMGATANRNVSSLLRVETVRKFSTGWGAITASRGQFSGGEWIGLPHLSHFKIMNREASIPYLNTLFEGVCDGLDTPKPDSRSYRLEG